MTLQDIQLETIEGRDSTLADFAGRALLIVNTASQCGLTPQYSGLQALHEELSGRGFAVLGFPCNQFKGQEPGTESEIKSFCESSFGVTFPMFCKVEVNGPGRHPLFERLTAHPDEEGKAGDVLWNFEKFLVSPTGGVVGRFRPLVAPDDPQLRAAIEDVLPDATLHQTGDESSRASGIEDRTT